MMNLVQKKLRHGWQHGDGGISSKIMAWGHGYGIGEREKKESSATREGELAGKENQGGNSTIAKGKPMGKGNRGREARWQERGNRRGDKTMEEKQGIWKGGLMIG